MHRMLLASALARLRRDTFDLVILETVLSAGVIIDLQFPAIMSFLESRV